MGFVFDGTDIYRAIVTISPVLDDAVVAAFDEDAASDPVTITLNYERSLEGNVSITVGGGSDVLLKSGFVQAKDLLHHRQAGLARWPSPVPITYRSWACLKQAT